MKNYTLILVGICSLLFFSAKSQILISQGGSVAVNNGDIFYDAGGAAGTDGNVSKTITLTPAVAGQAICIDFTTFKSAGTLEIFDGSTTAAKNIGTFTQDFTKKYDAGTGAGQDAIGSLAAELKPGIFCSNNASGTLTLKYTASGGGQPGWVGNIITHPISTGCTITLTGNPTTICNGSSTTLTATGTLGSPLLSNDFNTSTVGAGWNSTPGGVSFMNVLSCEPNNGFSSKNTDNSVFAWMQSVAAPRTLETNGFDVSLGGYISFDFRMAADDNGLNGCESPDNKEGVYVQYSKDNGATWTTMKLMFPAFPGGTTVMGCGDYVFNWGTTSLPIPAGAFSASTKFRWYQNSATSSTEDSWGLDNVKIYAYKNITLTISKNPTSAIADGTVLGSQNTSPYSLSVSPTTTTTYRARISDGLTSCYQDLTITVNPCGCTPPTINTQPLPSTICANSNTSFTVAATGGNGQYQWQVNTGGGFVNVTDGGVYSGATTATLSITAATAAMNTYQYQCIVKEAVGTCPTTSTAVALTVNIIPTLTITNPTAVCAPSTVDITAAGVTVGSTGGTTLTYWSNNIATISIANQAAIPISGTYYIKSTLNGCSDIKPVVVTINTTPSLTITNPTAVCAPSTVDITAAGVTVGSTGGGTLSYWTNAGATTSLASSNAVASSGTYYIKSTLGSCTDIKSVVVTINPSPSLSINNPTAVCSPNTIDITAGAVTLGSTGGGALSYWTNAAGTISLASPATISVSGTYYIKSTLGSCTDIKSVVVTINTTPSLTITNPTAVCSPNTVDITAATVTSGSTGGGVLSYWTNAGATTTLASPSVVAATGTYYIKSTLGSCTDTKPVVVTVNTTPSLSIHNPSAVCSPTTVDISLAAVTAGSTGGGALSYWTNAGATISLLSPSTVSTSGTYYIKSTLGSCSDIKPVVVTINTTPALTISDPTAVCSPLTIDITAAAVTSGSTGAGTLSYWNDLACTLPLASSNAIATSGTYYIKSLLGSCFDIKPVTVVINNCGCPLTIVTNAPTAVCSPATINLTQAAVTAGSTGGGALTYWTDAACTSPLATPSAVAISGTYYIKGSNGACSDSKPVLVTINTTPSLSIHDPAAVCNPTTIDLTLAAVTAGSTGGGTLSYWTNIGATTSLVNSTAVSITGTYYIKSTSGSCFDIKPVNTIVNPTPNLIITNPGAVCSPLTIDLTNAAITSGSTGGGTLSYWQDIAASTSLGTPNSVSTSGTYYIKSLLGSCFDIKPVTVTINTTPVLSIHNPAAICAPNTVDITGPAVTAGSTGAGTLTYWIDAGATQTLLSASNVPSSGTYYIKSTIGLCLDIDPVTVTINTTPVLSIHNPSAVCIPGTVDITLSAITSGSTGAGTLSYWNDINATSSLLNPTTISVSNTYYIKSLLGACFDIKPVVVTISAAPVLSITNPNSVCSPATVDITLSAVTNGSTGAGTLSYWTDAGTSISHVSPTTSNAGTYYIKSTVGSCSDTKSVVVTVVTTPLLSITNPNPACSPATIDLTAANITTGSTGGGVLSYWSDAAGTISIPSPNTINQTGIYYIKAANGVCSDIKPVNVMLDIPVLTITDPQAVCSPSTIDITAAPVTAGSTGVNTLTYFTDNLCTSALASPSTVNTSGTYYIKASNVTCSVSKAVHVTINAKPSLTISNPIGVCAPSTVDITAIGITAGSTNVGPFTYFTDAAANNVLNNSNAVATGGVYYIKSTLNGCSDIKPVTVTINNTPSLVISSPPAVCAPQTVNLTQVGITAGSTNLGPLTYFNDALCTQPLLNSNAVNTSGTYYIKSLAGACFDIKPVIVTINPKPIVVIGATASGCAPLKVDLTDPQLTTGSTPGAQFQYWNNATATTPLVTPTSVGNGTYYITSTLNNCVSTPQKVDVTIHPLPVANFRSNSDSISTMNPEINFINQSINGNTYFWDFGDGKFSQETEPKHTYPDTDSASFYVSLVTTSQFGCVDTMIKKIIVYEDLLYFIPNTFTPDEDNFNNIFQPIFVSGFDPYDFTMYIFNRWGEIVFETHDAKIGWRGTYGSSLTVAKDDVYTWKINFKLKSNDKRKEITGHVNLVK